MLALPVAFLSDPSVRSGGESTAMSRKRYRSKKRSCSVCKPSKTGRSHRFRPQEQVALKRFEKAVVRRDWNEL